MDGSDPLDRKMLVVTASADSRLRTIVESWFKQMTVREWIEAFSPRKAMRLRGLGSYCMGELAKCFAKVPALEVREWLELADPFLPPDFVMPPLAPLPEAKSVVDDQRKTADPLDRAMDDVLKVASPRLRGSMQNKGYLDMTVREFLCCLPRDVARTRNLGRTSFSELVFYLKTVRSPYVETWLGQASEYLPGGTLPPSVIAKRIAELEAALAHLRELQARAFEEMSESPAKRPTTFFPEVIRDLAEGKTLAEVGAGLGVSRERVRQRAVMTIEKHLPELWLRMGHGNRDMCDFLRTYRNDVADALAKASTANPEQEAR